MSDKCENCGGEIVPEVEMTERVCSVIDVDVEPIDTDLYDIAALVSQYGMNVWRTDGTDEF